MCTIIATRPASRPSNCAGGMISLPSSFERKPGKKVTHPRKKVDPIAAAIIRDIDKVDIESLYGMLEDTKVPRSMKRHCIRPEVNKRLLEAGGTYTPSAPAKASAYLLDELYDKRGSKREKALATVITLLNGKNLDHDDLKRRIVVTLLYRCLHGVKNGSATEMQYALKVIGLLSIVIDCQDKMSEIYREVLRVVSTKYCLKKAGLNTTIMLDCLGLVTFFGAINSEETQASMKVICDFMIPKSKSGYDNVVTGKKHSVEVLVAAINSWSFLLTSMEGWRLNQNHWKGAISFFMDLLEHHDDKIVHRAATTALALIFETGSLDKFWNNVHDSTSSYSKLQNTIRAMILKKLRGVNVDLEFVRYFETLCTTKASVTLCERKLVFSSWYRVIQVEFFSSFLGDQFENYMAKEWKLQNIFEFNPCRNNGGGKELYEPTTEKIMVRFFMPEGRDPYMLTAEERKREKVRRTSVIGKAQTQLRAKQRLLSKELKSCD